jgi:WD40 repeat protein
MLCLAIAWLGCIATAHAADEAEAEQAAPIPVRAVAFSPDGAHLAVGYGDREIAGGLLIWNVADKRAEKRIELKPGVSSLAFSADGKHLALSQYGQAPRLLHWPSLELDAELEANRRGPVAFSPDSSLLATGCEDHNIYCWDVASRSDKLKLEGHANNAYTIAFSSDGQRLVSAAQPGVLAWDLASGKKELAVQHGSSLNSSAIFSPDGRWLLTGGWDGSVRQWDAATGMLRCKLGGWGGVDRLAYSPQASALAVIGIGNSLALYDLNFEPPSPELTAQVESALAKLDNDSYDVREAASAELVKLGLVADAELARLAKESTSTEVRIRARRARQAIGAQPQEVLQKHTGRTRCLALDPSGLILASGADDGTVQLWDLAGRKHIGGFVAASGS